MELLSCGECHSVWSGTTHCGVPLSGSRLQFYSINKWTDILQIDQRPHDQHVRERLRGLCSVGGRGQGRALVSHTIVIMSGRRTESRRGFYVCHLCAVTDHHYSPILTRTERGSG